MAGTKLNPCPFCGSNDVRIADVCSITFVGNCMDCGASCGCTDTEEEAIAAWNSRADDYKQAAEYWQHMYEQSFTERTCRNCAALNRAAGLWAKADKRARELERTCRMSPSDYYPCAEDDCMRLKVRMWTCSECEADYVGSKPNYCPNCGRRVVK